MSNLVYCKSWFRAKKSPIQIWDEGKAREAHEARKLYTVLLGDPERPQCFIEINNDFVGVSFLDDKLRETLTYQFQEIEDGKLFLTMATYRDFEGDTDKVSEGTSYIFNQDGNIQIRKESFNPHDLKVSDTNGDVDGNYEDYPGFGSYESIALAERK